MTHASHSAYIRYNNQSALVRRWIAMILLQSDLESTLLFSGLEPMLTRGFDTSPINRDNCEDPKFIRAWLASELERCGNEAFDESDVFAINTRRIQKSMGLNKVELAVLRFACLVNCYKPLEAAAELGGICLAEADLCDLLSSLLDLPFSLIFKALRPTGLLRQSGLVSAGDNWSGTQHVTRWLRTPDMVAREVFRPQNEDNLLLNVFYTTAPKSTLTQHDFPQRTELGLLKRYLRASLKEGATGANILLWGPPGTGKTEMARHLAQSLRKKALEINTVDLNKQALKATDRLDCYRFCQAILARSSNALVVFDEVEEILSDGSFSEFGFKSEKGFTKGLLNTVLESNSTPAIWITNTVRGVDPAYLRRFDMVVQLNTPVERFKKKIAWRVFKDLPINESVVERMVRHKKVTPAHFEKVNRICRRIGVSTPEEAGLVASKILNGDLKAVHARPLEAGRPEKKRGIELPYRPNLINCDTDIQALTENLDAAASVRICSFGPPGTGKTAWARHLAESIGKPLLVKHAADVLDKFLGETEKNTAEIFREAEKTNSVLMLDEVDSFLPDRANASRHWEITQANQFLTAMESFDGILICATNLKDNLDPATMRRFDFKINFDYLETEQAALIAIDLLEALGGKVTKSQESALCAAFRGLELAHGDFAALLRRYTAMKVKPDWRVLVEDLRTEASFRQPSSQAIGFMAQLH